MVTPNSETVKYTYYCDDTNYPRRDQPDKWSEVGNGNGAMYGSYPVFSKIPMSDDAEEPLRFGDFNIDIDSGGALAVAPAVRIIEWFEEIYDVLPEQWRIYLSGKKGVHLELPASILGIVEGHPLLPLGYKRLAIEIESAVGVAVDTSLYCMGTGRPYRRPNVKRSSGTYKRQIPYDQFVEIADDDDYLTACSDKGETWGPKDSTLNFMITAKLDQFLKEAEELHKEMPRLSEEQVAALADGVPECAVFWSQQTEKVGDIAYNDAAMQITAYAVSAGMSEDEFVSFAQPFINAYPCNSLGDSLEKRDENCRNRYRTIKAHEYQHSCGGMIALAPDCITCDDCPVRQAEVIEAFGEYTFDADAVDDEPVITGIGLHIPEHLYQGVGWIGRGIESLVDAGVPEIVPYLFPTVCIHIANAISSKAYIDGTKPNLFVAKVGATSTGKTFGDQIISEYLTGFYNIYDFYGPDDFASGVGLVRYLSKNPCCLVVVDEATSLLRKPAQGDSVAAEKRSVLLDLYSAKDRYLKVYSNPSNNIEIKAPNVSIIGNATKVIFEDIDRRDFETGMIQRIDFYVYDGPAVKRPKSNMAKLSSFGDFIANIYNKTIGTDCSLYRDKNVTLRKGARDVLEQHSDYVIDRQNDVSEDWQKGIISRSYDLAKKYALIHHTATQKAPWEDVVEVESIQWGIDVSRLLSDWKINKLRGMTFEGEFHRDCEMFISAIRACVSSKLSPTQGVLVNRRVKMKEWDQRHFNSVAKKLETDGAIKIDRTNLKSLKFHLSL